MTREEFEKKFHDEWLWWTGWDIDPYDNEPIMFIQWSKTSLNLFVDQNDDEWHYYDQVGKNKYKWEWVVYNPIYQLSNGKQTFNFAIDTKKKQVSFSDELIPRQNQFLMISFEQARNEYKNLLNKGYTLT